MQTKEQEEALELYLLKVKLEEVTKKNEWLEETLKDLLVSTKELREFSLRTYVQKIIMVLLYKI